MNRSKLTDEEFIKKEYKPSFMNSSYTSVKLPPVQLEENDRPIHNKPELTTQMLNNEKLEKVEELSFNDSIDEPKLISEEDLETSVDLDNSFTVCSSTPENSPTHNNF